MDNLTAFIAARLDEKQQFAEGLVAHPPRGVSGMRGIAEQMLREVAALRKLLAEIDKAEVESDAEDTIVISGYVADDLRGIIAAIWSDRPDYRPEWKPGPNSTHLA